MAENATELKERTGTCFFMAIELLNLEATDVIHSTHHDLESFIWVLVWIVLRHTAHDHWRKTEACSATFIYGDDDNATSAKQHWTMARESRPLTVFSNAPLTNLLAGLHKLLLVSVSGSMEQRIKLIYDAVLAVFESAIHSNDWPLSDAAISFVPPKPNLAKSIDKPNLANPTHKQKKRTRTRLEDEETDEVLSTEEDTGTVASQALPSGTGTGSRAGKRQRNNEGAAVQSTGDRAGSSRAVRRSVRGTAGSSNVSRGGSNAAGSSKATGGSNTASARSRKTAALPRRAKKA
ncbi:hypothetical protein BC628DRAFT_1395015 [Trametes gibbosa]|nr:hypothetical protein BC628DRAFT_1395015 [Trametes gibbosa]